MELEVHGVILVTTKKGTPGSTMVEYNAFTSIDQIARSMDVMTAEGIGSSWCCRFWY